jgi:hypothetical protein
VDNYFQATATSLKKEVRKMSKHILYVSVFKVRDVMDRNLETPVPLQVLVEVRCASVLVGRSERERLGGECRSVADAGRERSE